MTSVSLRARLLLLVLHLCALRRLACTDPQRTDIRCSVGYQYRCIASLYGLRELRPADQIINHFISGSKTERTLNALQTSITVIFAITSFY
jgi:hypothetical protein